MDEKRDNVPRMEPEDTTPTEPITEEATEQQVTATTEESEIENGPSVEESTAIEPTPVSGEDEDKTSTVADTEIPTTNSVDEPVVPPDAPPPSFVNRSQREKTEETPIVAPPKKKSSFPVKWVVGTALTTVVILICASVVGYLGYVQIRSNLETSGFTELTAPIFDVEPIANQIAFIGNDRNVYTVTPDGEDLQQMTDDGRGYSFPTWAPDSRRLAFIGPDSNDNTSLYMAAASNGETDILYNEPNSAPFYLYWAPDSQSITFLTQERSGLAMRQANARIPDEQRLLEQGAPFYWAWSPNSEKLLMHVGGSRAVSDEAHISLLHNEEEAIRIELDLAPGGFQAPVWSSNGQYFFYIASDEDDDTVSIYRNEAETLEQIKLTNLDGFAYMVLAPDDNHIAYLQIERGDRPPFGTAYIVGTEGNGHKKLTERPVSSMYWAPDGSKVALLTFAESGDGSTAKAGGLASPLSQEVNLRWWIYDVEKEELQPLVSFNPTAAFLQTVPYFDQYHLSLTFWSPDSRYFVVTREKRQGSGGNILVMDTEGKEEPIQVGEGTIAVWSWQ